VDTTGYGGRELRKSAVVDTDDPRNPAITLQISGKVARFVTVIPASVQFSGPVGTPMTAVVRILPEPEYPFTVLSIAPQKGVYIRCDLQRVTESGRPVYLVNVENLKADKGRYHDVVLVKTDSGIRPEIKISIFGNLYERPPKSQS
jgi:hypothetical protein